MLRHFCLSFAVFLVFLTAQWLVRHTGEAQVFDYDLYLRTRACFVYLYHHPRSHFTKLFTWALFFGPCHCSYIFVPCLAFRVHVAGDLNNTISFVDVLTSFARALLGLIGVRGGGRGGGRPPCLEKFQRKIGFQGKRVREKS